MLPAHPAFAGVDWLPQVRGADAGSTGERAAAFAEGGTIMANAKVSMSTSAPTEGGTVSAQLEIELPPEHLLILLDKTLSPEREVGDAIKVGGFPYEGASQLLRALAGAKLSVAGVEPTATALEDEIRKVRNFGDLLALGEQALKNLRIEFAAGQLVVYFEDKEIARLDLKDVRNLRRAAPATGADGPSAVEGAEVIAENAAPAPRRLQIRRVARVTADGDDDTLSTSTTGDNDLKQQNNALLLSLVGLALIGANGMLTLTFNVQAD
jgi:hypothetical protein